MNSPLLRRPARRLAPLLLVAALWLLLRGHNQPGGGFAGGLVAAGAFALIAFAEGVAAVRSILRVSPSTLTGAGIATAAFSGFVGAALGKGFLGGAWLPWAIPGIGKIGTPVLFDLGVMLTVAGMALQILLPLMEQKK